MFAQQQGAAECREDRDAQLHAGSLEGAEAGEGAVPDGVADAGGQGAGKQGVDEARQVEAQLVDEGQHEQRGEGQGADEVAGGGRQG
ncbi:hypothetical protein D9M71_527370 [compost metagenome]